MAAPSITFDANRGGCNGAPPLLFWRMIMTKKFLWMLAPFLLLSCSKLAEQTPQEKEAIIASAPASQRAVKPVETTYVVVENDELNKRFGGAKNGTAVCKLNKLANCDRLRVGQKLRVPAGIQPQTPAVKQAKAVTPSKPAPATVQAVSSVAPKAQRQAAAVTPRVSSNRDAEGYLSWNVVGLRNLRIFQGTQYLRHTQVLVMRKMGLSEAEIMEVVEALKSGTAEAGEMTAGMKFALMSYSTKSGVKVLEKVKYVGAETHRIYRIRLSSGRIVTIVEKCDNVGLEEAPPPPPVLVEEIPPLPPTLVPPPPYLPPPPEAKKFCHAWRVNAVVGAEVEIHKDLARSLYGAWGIYCMKLLKDGQIGFGPAGQMAVYASDPGSDGHFNGHLIQAGVGMMRVWNSGKDLEAKLMIGHYSSNYRESDYRSSENRWGIGFSAAFNDYHGRIDGSGDPETQGFFNLFVPVLGGSSEHSWQGQDLGDTSALKLYANIGIRRYLLKEDPDRKWNPYAQIGALTELRTGEDYFSCSVRVGVTNQRRTIGVHAGVNACDGGIVPAVGAWYDIGTDLRLKRAERRAAALLEDTGEGREATITFEGRVLDETREGVNDNDQALEYANDNGEGPQAETVPVAELRE